MFYDSNKFLLNINPLTYFRGEFGVEFGVYYVFRRKQGIGIIAKTVVNVDESGRGQTRRQII